MTPAWPFRLPRASGPDGVLQVRAASCTGCCTTVRQSEPVVVRVAQTARDRVLFGAPAADPAAAAWGIERMRFALGVDDDLRPFHERFRDDPLIGARGARATRRCVCGAGPSRSRRSHGRSPSS